MPDGKVAILMELIDGDMLNLSSIIVRLQQERRDAQQRLGAAIDVPQFNREVVSDSFLSFYFLFLSFSHTYLCFKKVRAQRRGADCFGTSSVSDGWWDA